MNNAYCFYNVLYLPQFFKTILFALFIALLVHPSEAQDLTKNSGSVKCKKFFFALEGQALRSTHSQTIFGVSVVAGVILNRSVSMGIGAEISHVDSLFTHDKYTTILRFNPMPVYLEARWSLASQSKIIPFAILASGLSVINYYRKHYEPGSGAAQIGNFYQSGFFVKAGAGIRYRFSEHFGSTLSACIKGFHFSSNRNEINPHGLTFQLGIFWRPDR